jgi:hypothetical protein
MGAITPHDGALEKAPVNNIVPDAKGILATTDIQHEKS